MKQTSVSSWRPSIKQLTQLLDLLVTIAGGYALAYHDCIYCVFAFVMLAVLVTNFLGMGLVAWDKKLRTAQKRSIASTVMTDKNQAMEK